MDKQTIEQHNEKQRTYYGRHVRTTMTPGPTPYVSRHIDEVLSFGEIPRGAHVLDVGCGMGRQSFLLADRGYQVEGLELSPYLLDRMREFDGGRYNIPRHCADIHNPPAHLTGRFDAVVGFFMLHHLLDLKAVFRGVEKMLRPGGACVFIEPNPANPLYYAQIFLTPGMKWSAEKGITNMREAKMFAAMDDAGLNETAVRRFGFFPPFLRNRSWGGPVETALERIPFMDPILPFQLFRAHKPDSHK